MNEKILIFKNPDALKYPDDLISINDFCEKYGVKYHYIYKLSVRLHRFNKPCIKPYYWGGVKISEREAKEFLKRICEKWRE